MLADIQRRAIPELTRVYGQYGLYLRPSAEISTELSGNMVGALINLRRQQGQMVGQLRCLDHELPLGSASLSLVYSLFMLETSARPAELMLEIARCLKPEGIVLLIGLNRWSPARLLGGVGQAFRRAASDERLARSAGLDLLRCQHLGPFWPSAQASKSNAAGNGWFDGFRAAHLLVLRRRESALTPLRKAIPAVSLRPGMSAG